MVGGGALRRVGKYEVGRTIGEGTFAKVKFAQNTESGESVAMKVVDRSSILKHKMADQVLASRKKIFIILEFITGGELFDKIIRHGRLNEADARRYFQQLIDGVDFCHSKGVYHRDLKPENLLLDSQGNLKISDFGLSAGCSGWCPFTYYLWNPKLCCPRGSAAPVHEDEAGLWFPFADSLEKDIFSDLFYEAPVAAAATAAAAGLGADGDSDGEGKPCKDDAAMAEERGGPGAARPDAAAQYRQGVRRGPAPLERRRRARDAELSALASATREAVTARAAVFREPSPAPLDASSTAGRRRAPARGAARVVADPAVAGDRGDGARHVAALRPGLRLRRRLAAGHVGCIVKKLSGTSLPPPLYSIHDGRSREPLLPSSTPSAAGVLSHKGYDGALADTWSCGVILYVLLAGYLPFDEVDLTTLYGKIESAEYSFPAWFPNGAKSLIHRILDPNPDKRIRIEEIRNDEWFKKNYEPTREIESEEVNLDDVNAAFDDPEEDADHTLDDEAGPLTLNAFDLIILSQGLNLAALFDRRQDYDKLQNRFLSRKPAKVIMSSMEVVAQSMGYKTHIRNYKTYRHEDL
ncbi:hypothetical protein OsJ_02106 [Oryza sativa Japonica Group]|uniref:non-specific serine/threonine protein kinase n=1 Tax=Oryza sativa subsp. japonica TaxID=39947 RepID=B9EXD3_ORYSJ|nr:hypothetical protein OsJ_02106 [Oryza sativa Japonica Group]